MPWLDNILADISAHTDIGAGLRHLFQHLHNEMTAGSGQTQPTAVTQELCERADEVVGVLVANTSPETTAPAKPTLVPDPEPEPTVDSAAEVTQPADKRL